MASLLLQRYTLKPDARFLQAFEIAARLYGALVGPTKGRPALGAPVLSVGEAQLPLPTGLRAMAEEMGEGRLATALRVLAGRLEAGEPLEAVESRIWRNGDGYVFGSWRQMRCAWFGPKSGTEAGEPVAAKL